MPATNWFEIRHESGKVAHFESVAQTVPEFWQAHFGVPFPGGSSEPISVCMLDAAPPVRAPVLHTAEGNSAGAGAVTIGS